MVTTTLNSIAWTNDTDDDVPVQIDHSVFGAISNTGTGTGSIWFSYEYSISGGGASAAIASPLLSTGSLGEERGNAYVDTATVGAGLTITVTLKAKVAITSGVQVRNTWRDAVTRVTAIKR